MAQNTASDIGQWLDSMGLAQYTQAFIDNAIELKTLPKLSNDDLKELGVLMGHRKTLLEAIGALVAEPQPVIFAQPVLTEAERRQLTVMFCDLVGSTELSSRLDPEDLREIIQRYQSTCAKVIERYGGYIAQYLGDGIVVYFGYPHAQEDAADRAVRTGLEIVTAVAALPVSNGTNIQVRLGIATGIAVVGDLIGKGASEQHAVIGQTPNLAARVQSLAKPGSLVIAESTRKLIGEQYEFHDLGAQQFKGIGGVVQVWQVLCEREDTARFESPRLTRSACVGREREVEVLLEKWRKCASGTGQVVLAWGEAGIGKSRLLRLFGDRLAGETFTRMHLQCSPQHGASPLYPSIRSILKALAFVDADSVDDKLDKIEAFLSPSGQIGSAPLLASLLSVPYAERYPALTLTPEEQKAATLKFCVDYVIGMAKSQPILYQFEDIHWIDPTSEELLVRLIDRIHDQPIFVLVTGRPECRPAWLDRVHTAALDLGRLGEAETRAIVHSITAGKLLPEEVMAQILAKTDGVPLFVEELTRTVLESGLLRETGGAWVLDGPLPAMAIPATLQDSLMARLDRLASAKDVVQAAAAIGRRFSHAMLAAVLDQPEAVIRAALGRLAEAELIFPPSASTGRDYLFKHALVLDAAYDSLLKSRRHALHARIVRALETHFPDTLESQPELLAHHAARAGLAEQAIKYGLKAGQQALSRSANLEALSHLRRALELLNTLPEDDARDATELALQLSIGQASMVVHGYAASETEAAFERAKNLAEQIDKPEHYGRVMYGLVSMHQINGRLSLSAELADQVLERSKQSEDQALAYLGHRMIGANALHRGDLRSARFHLRQAIEDPNQSIAAPAYCYLAFAESQMGNLDTALRLSEVALSLAREAKHALNVGQAMHFNDVVHGFRKDFQAQLIASNGAVEFCEKNNVRFFAAWARAVNAYARVKLFDVEAAFQVEAYFSELQQVANVGPLARTYLHSVGAEILNEQGQPERAIKELEIAFKLIAANGEHWFEPETERIHGECLMALAPPKIVEAEASFRRALEKAHAMGALTFQLSAALSFHKFLERQGRAGEGLTILAPIYAQVTEGFDLPDQREANAILNSA